MQVICFSLLVVSILPSLSTVFVNRALVNCFTLIAMACLIPYNSRILINFPNELMYIDYTIYEITSRKLFWLTLLQQTLVTNVNAVFTTTFDSIITGYMLQICAQLDILKWKLTNVPKLDVDSQYEAIAKCIRLHLTISRFIVFHFKNGPLF